MERPGLPPTVEVLAGTDVDACWDEFKLFEALHFELRLCNPFSLRGISRVVDLLDPEDGEAMADFGCGHGELLLQAAERSNIAGTGIDLSPWALRRAVEAQTERVPEADVRWILGDASRLNGSWDIVSALGVSWVWGGYEGTVDALLSRCRVDGTIAIGDLQLRPGADRSKIAKDYGKVLTREEQLRLLESRNVQGATEVVPGADDWHDSYERMTEAVARYAAEHPGKEAEKFKRHHEDWMRKHRRAAEALTWTVFVGWKGSIQLDQDVA